MSINREKYVRMEIERVGDTMKRNNKRKVQRRLLTIICMLIASMGLAFYAMENHSEEPVKPVVAKKDVQKVRFSAVGDILMEEGIYDWLGENFDFKDYFDDVKPILKGDVMFMNQEAIVGGEEFGIRRNWFVFNTDAKVTDQLLGLGFNLVSLANNHILDMGLKGVANTLEYWRQCEDIVYSGIYDSESDRESLRILEKNGLKFGLLAYTSFTNKDFYDPSGKYDIPYLNLYHFGDKQKEMLKKDIERIRPEVDFLVVSVHWGDEGYFEVNDIQRETSKFMNELGVDLIIGHHPHVMQPCEWITNESNGHQTFVAYSLGNFICSDPDIYPNTDEGSAYTLSSVLTMDIIKEEGKVRMENVAFTPLINHFTADDEDYHLYPVWLYNDSLASEHARNYYNSDVFDVEWVKNQVNEVMDNGAVRIRMTRFWYNNGLKLGLN